MGQDIRRLDISNSVMDKLLHHCTIVNIRRKSYRLKEKQKAELAGMLMVIVRSGKLRKSD